MIKVRRIGFACWKKREQLCNEGVPEKLQKKREKKMALEFFRRRPRGHPGLWRSPGDRFSTIDYQAGGDFKIGRIK